MTVSLCSLNAKGKKKSRAKKALSVKIKIHPWIMQNKKKNTHVICSKALIQDELQKISFNCHYEGLK